MNWISRSVVAACVAAGLAPCVAVAQVTWTGTTGNGDWSTAGAFAGSGGGLTLANGFSQAFVFAGTPAIVSTTNTLAGGTATSVTFNSGAGAFSLSGSSMVLTGSIANLSTSLQTINLGLNLTRTSTIAMTAGGGNLVLAGPIGQVSGSTGALRIVNAGTITLSGSNSYGGDTTMATAGQTLVIGNNNALGQATGGLNFSGGGGTINVTTGSSFTIANNITNLNGPITFTGSGNLSTTGTFQFGGGNRTLTVSSGTLTLGQIDAGGSSSTTRVLTKSGNGTLVVTGPAGSNFQGGMTLDGGLTIFGNSSAMGQGVLVLGSGTMSSIGSLTISNTTNINPSSATTIAGTSSITFTGPFSNGASGARTVTNNLDRTSALLTFSGPILLSGGGPMTFSGTGNTTFSGSISGVPTSGNALSITSTGTTTLSGVNTHSGTTNFNSVGGTLVLGNDAALGSSVLRVDTSTATVSASPAFTSTNTIILFTNVNFGGTNSMTFGAAVNGQNNERAITNNLPAGQTLTFSGTTTIRGVGDGTNRVFVVGGAGNTVFNNTLVDGGTAGTGGLTINSTGTTTLAVANTYTGPTTVNAGVLMLSNAAALGSGNLRLDTGGVVALNAGDLTSGTGGGAGQVRIVTSGGFAAFGSPRIVAFGGTSAPTALTWGDGVFLGSSGTFTLGAPGATDTLDFRNAVALGSAGTTRQVLVNDGPAALEGTMSGVLSGAANLRKIGPGALRLAGVNTFTGTASIGAGVLEITATTGLRDVARVVIDGGATFRYAGTSGTFAKPITVTAASGTGSIENTGGGTLTLSGAISKDNSVLRLSGGVFNVTGVISGATVNASDLLVTGTSTVTLSAVNTYNGPTFVNQSSTLIVGVAGAVPDNSFVTVGDGGSTGTLALAAGVSDAIGGLAFGSAGGTLRIATNSTSGPLLTTAGTMTLSGGTLDLAGSGSTAGLYNVLSGGLVSGEFASVTGTSAAYRVIYSNTAVDYQQRAVLGAVSVTSTVAKIISGGTAAFTYTVANAALSGGQDLSFTGAGLSNIAGSSSGTAAAATTTSAIVGLAYTGTAVGLGQQGTFTVSGPDAFGTTSTTGTVNIDVLNHSLASFQSTSSATLSLDLGTFDGGSWTTGSGSFGYSVWNIASGGFTDIETAGLEFYDVVFSSGDDVFSTGWSSFANLVSGSSADFTASVTSPGSLAPTSYSGVYTLRFRDQQDLSGAINTRNLTLTLNVVVVPEPASLALAAAGIGAASLLRARRRRPA